MGCARVKGFEAFGLRTRDPGTGQEAWLIMPHSSQVFLVKEAIGQ